MADIIYPRWMNTTCIWCGKNMTVNTVTTTEDTVQVDFICSNPKCDKHLGMVYTGKKFVEIYQKAIEPPKTTEEKPVALE